MKILIYPGICILCLICILQGIYIRSVKKQLSEWLTFLKSVRTSPMPKVIRFKRTYRYLIRLV